MMKIYISLPITGHDIEEVEASCIYASGVIQAKGHIPVSPFDISPDPDAHALHMFSDREGGLTDEQFCDEVQDYVRENHYDDRLSDIAQDWCLPLHGLVKKILQELSIADRTVEGGEK